MASPQLENGFTQIANELLEALSLKRLAGQEYQVVLAIIRKTYGFNKKEDVLSYGQISEETGLDRRRVNKIIKDLRDKNILSVTNNGDRVPATIGINKDYEQWQTVTKKHTIPNNEDIPNNGVSPIPNNDVKPIPNNGDHNIKKEKKETPAHFLDFAKRFQEYQLEHLGEKLIKADEKTIQDGAEALEKLCRLDSFNFDDEVQPALFWAVKSEFWSKQIRSLGNIRVKSKNGEIKFKNLYVAYLQDKPKKQAGVIY